MDFFSISGGSRRAGVTLHANPSTSFVSPGGSAIRELADETPKDVKQADQTSSASYSFRTQHNPPKVVYVRNREQANIELASLRSENSRRNARLVGFDIEWRPGIRQSESRIALVQIAVTTKILLIQLSAMTAFPDGLTSLLVDRDIMKAGVGILGDAQRIYRDFGVNVHSCAELSYLARSLDHDRWLGQSTDLISLARLAHEYTGYSLPKGNLQKSNWEDELTAEQIHYAANDAHASMIICEYLLKRASRLDRSLFTFDVIRANAVHTDGQAWHVRIFPPPAEKPWPSSTRTETAVPQVSKDRLKTSIPGTSRSAVKIYQPSNACKPFRSLRLSDQSGGTRKLIRGFTFKDDDLLAYESTAKQEENRDVKTVNPCLVEETEADPFGWGSAFVPIKM